MEMNQQWAESFPNKDINSSRNATTNCHNFFPKDFCRYSCQEFPKIFLQRRLQDLSIIKIVLILVVNLILCTKTLYLVVLLRYFQNFSFSLPETNQPQAEIVVNNVNNNNNSSIKYFRDFCKNSLKNSFKNSFSNSSTISSSNVSFRLFSIRYE